MVLVKMIMMTIPGCQRMVTSSPTGTGLKRGLSNTTSLRSAMLYLLYLCIYHIFEVSNVVFVYFHIFEVDNVVFVYLYLMYTDPRRGLYHILRSGTDLQNYVWSIGVNKWCSLKLPPFFIWCGLDCVEINSLQNLK